MKRWGLLVIMVALLLNGCASSDKGALKKEGADVSASAKQEQSTGAEVAPAKLTSSAPNPITPENTADTPLARPKVVKAQDLSSGKEGQRRYFEVVDDKLQQPKTPVADENAKPARIVTFDNNAVRKDYPMRFGTAWDRVVEAMISLPVTTVDRSSGVIITDWLYGELKGEKKGILTSSSQQEKLRYRYTILLRDMGNMTQITVTPFTEVLRGQQWDEAKPAMLVTTRMFEKLERELAYPLPGER